MSAKDPRLSHQTLRVLRVLLDDKRPRLAGSDITEQTNILSGTLYPLLMRLEKAGWLDSKWEELDPCEAGRPRKRLYQLTPNGYNKAQSAIQELTVGAGRLAWKS